MEPTVLFENDDVLVIDKPSGMSMHGDGLRVTEGIPTIADWFVAKYPEAAGVGEPLELNDGRTVDRPGIVHRLDKGTSGVVVLAKRQSAYEFLKKQFQDRLVQKEYVAIVWGEMKNDSGTVEYPIGRSVTDFRRRSAEKNAKPPLRDARTDYEVIARGGGFTLVRLRPKTGRMHQIRVHMKAVGHPLVGDGLYAPRRDASVLGFNRLALHAENLTIILPSGETQSFAASLPGPLNRAIFQGLWQES
ncbi:MAG: RluA family pseudouridine synthase [Patescibacteria group bacterium]